MDNKSQKALDRAAFAALVDRIMSRVQEDRAAQNMRLDDTLMKLLCEPAEVSLFREISTTPSLDSDCVNALDVCAPRLFGQARSVEVDGEALAWLGTLRRDD